MASQARRATTVLTHPSSLPPGVESRTVGPAPSVDNLARELLPLPVVRGGEAPTWADVAKMASEQFEAVRQATLPLRTDPEAAPCYVRGIKFENTSNAEAVVTQVIKHTLGRPVTGITCTRSQAAPYRGYQIKNAPGLDPRLYVTISSTVPANTTAVHALKLIAD